MSKTAKRLGRGLDSLISNLRGGQVEDQAYSENTSRPVNKAAGDYQKGTPKPDVFHVEQAIGTTGKPTLVDLPIDLLQPNPYQPRTIVANEALSSLAASIKKSGIMQPITIRKRDGRNEIIAGERRWLAAKAIGLKTVPVIVREADDEQMLELAIIENTQREDLNAIDRAKAYKRFCTRFNVRPEDLADRLGEDRSTVVNYIRILELPPPVQELIAANKLGMGHGRCLLGITEQRRREELAQSAVKSEWSVRTLEQMVRGTKESPSTPSAPTLAKASPHLRDLQQRFERSLKTKVTIVEGRRKGSGRIVIEYFSLDDFDRIASALGVQTDA